MASFKVHAVTALVASVGAAAYTVALNHFPLYLGGLLCTLGFIGGLAPDVDSGETKMARYSGLGLGASLSLFAYFLSHSYLIAIIGFIPLVKLIQVGIKKWTTHRGVFHSLPMGLLLSIVVFYLFDSLGFSPLFSLFCGGFLGGGYLLHLVLDEIWSLRKGIGKQCSFGTALQLYRPIFWKSFLATYALLGFAIYKLPFSWF
jgi:hypothetical protein